MKGDLSAADTIEFAKLYPPGKGRHRKPWARDPVTVWDVLFALTIYTYIAVLIVLPYFF